ncbi:MAG TPA: class I SAM-dependent methyltransferase [Dongiaceae bacterium]|nr:class I SAM-dependent methyltransferase [Dongiaceae bacterium]
MVRTGILATKDGAAHYPIINGIPRFVSKEFYSSSFGFEWRKWPRVQFESENVGRPMEGHTTRMFKAITRLAEGDVRGRTIVEFGCGPGRFLDVIRIWGGVAVGIDLSLAVESARENFRDDADVLIVQGDILHPPFKKDIFDFGYTIGVLHHTPDPATGIKALANVVKPKGKISCCVYSKLGFYNYPSVYLFRKITSALERGFGNGFSTKCALAYSYFAAYVLYYCFQLVKIIPLLGSKAVTLIETYLLVNLSLPDIRWRILDVFDAITPRYASTHTPEEMREWFAAAGCTQLQQTNWGDTSFVAVKDDNDAIAKY